MRHYRLFMGIFPLFARHQTMELPIGQLSAATVLPEVEQPGMAGVPGCSFRAGTRCTFLDHEKVCWTVGESVHKK